jgi:hypothetical protein
MRFPGVSPESLPESLPGSPLHVTVTASVRPLRDVRLCVYPSSPASLPLLDFGALVPSSTLKASCCQGVGLAACHTLGLLVTSESEHHLESTLSVWTLPAPWGSGPGPGITLVCTLGGEGSPPPMQFKFGVLSGMLAFLPPAAPVRVGASTPPLLLVADQDNDAVHLVDVVGRAHVGYVAAPGLIAGPCGVAASANGASPLVAVSAWKEYSSGDHVVHLFASNGTTWDGVRVIGGGFGDPGAADGQLQMPSGLRFSADGTAIIVVDGHNDRVSLFRVGDGGFVRHIATGMDEPNDVEEVEGGWAVTCLGPHTVEFVGSGGGGGGRPCLEKAGGVSGSGDEDVWHPTTLAQVPGLGLVVRDNCNLQIRVRCTASRCFENAQCLFPHCECVVCVRARACACVCV